MNLFKKLFLFIVISSSFSAASLNAQLLSGYNQQLYKSVFDAAEGVGMPFLLQQGYKQMLGVEIYQDTLLMYNGQIYKLMNHYQNPEAGNKNNYYIPRAQYGSYQIEIFTNVWHIDIPNILYNYSDFTFSSLGDCVGYGTRLLSAVGDTTETGNAYLNLIQTIKAQNTTRMAVRGFVASAYEFGAAFPTLPDVNPNGWEYVSGNIIPDSINAFNHRTDPNINQYNGRIKGGYEKSQAGDILAFSYTPESKSNGHFMVMTETPYQMNFDSLKHYYPNVPSSSIQNFLNTYNVFATPVYDCSGQNVHFHDTRKYSSGIGHGILWVLTDLNTNTPQGFIFEPPSNSATTIETEMLSGEHTWAITVGRYDAITNIGSSGSSTIPQDFQLTIFN